MPISLHRDKATGQRVKYKLINKQGKEKQMVALFYSPGSSGETSTPFSSPNRKGNDYKLLGEVEFIKKKKKSSVLAKPYPGDQEPEQDFRGRDTPHPKIWIRMVG